MKEKGKLDMIWLEKFGASALGCGYPSSAPFNFVLITRPTQPSTFSVHDPLRRCAVTMEAGVGGGVENDSATPKK